jgi:hypothetical protein
MDAVVAAGTLHAPDPLTAHGETHLFEAGAGNVPATLRVTAARGHLRRHRSSAMPPTSPSSRFLASDSAALATPPHAIFQHPARRAI